MLGLHDVISPALQQTRAMAKRRQSRAPVDGFNWKMGRTNMGCFDACIDMPSRVCGNRKLQNVNFVSVSRQVPDEITQKALAASRTQN